MLKKPLLPILSLSVVMLLGCEGMEGGGGDSGGSDSTLSITLRASNLTDAQSGKKPQTARAVSDTEAADLPMACNDFFLPGPLENGNYDDAGPRSGSCITPVSVTGHVDSINLGGDYFGGGIRLLGGGSGFGQDYILEGSVIDLADPLSLGGEDNAQDTDFAHHNSRVSTVFNYLDVQFAVPRTDEATQESTAEYWTYRYAFVPYPFSQEPVYTRSEPTPGDVTYTETGNTLADCLATDFPEAGEMADANNAQLLAGATGVKTGDILICRKTSATDSCTPDDFKWLDITSGQFVDNRPAKNEDVFRFTRMANHKITCESQHDGPGFSVDLGGFDIHAALYKDIQFSADIDRDSKIYEFQYANDLDSNKKGSEMYLFIDLDFSNSLFVHDDDDTSPTDMTLNEFNPDYSVYESLEDDELARLIWFKPILLWENSSCEDWAPGDCRSVNTGVKAQVGVELSGNTEHPVYVCEEEQDSSVECVGSETPSDSSELQ
ncbi:hypothetical protein [Saccharospirillum salsuginis]|uniref:Lipoprotein n=1 Tax=Saccharospirillum salsuginis TaxID=418750 RepID=A0A918KL05_9GAMM|nr:hypothetical protein [Saccharospirillum salsuginis]GGX64909.1 hypothetical protein GCM10007392_35960 [Saccharospirillum salsuginis]